MNQPRVYTCVPQISKETQTLDDVMDQLDLIDIYRIFHPNGLFDMSVLRSFAPGLVTGLGAAVELCHNSFHKGKRGSRRAWLQAVKESVDSLASPCTWRE